MNDMYLLFEITNAYEITGVCSEHAADILEKKKTVLLVFCECFVKRQKSAPQNQNGQVDSVCIWDVDFKQIKKFSTIKHTFVQLKCCL